MPSAELLLAGPRGRGVCMAVAELGGTLGSTWFYAARHPSDPDLRRRLAKALTFVDLDHVRQLHDPLLLVEPIRDTVDAAMYWQPPHDEDVVVADPMVVEALMPVAEALLTAPAAAWWASPTDLEQLRYTSRYESGDSIHSVPVPPELDGTAERLMAWRQEMQQTEARFRQWHRSDPRQRVSGAWDSIPAGSGLPCTTRPLGSLGALALEWEEDSFGLSEAMIWPLRTRATPRIYEITRPSDFSDLVRAYPLDVTESRQVVWGETTGHTGRWLTVDYRAAAADWDAIHLTVAGYLTGATRALPVNSDTATVLAAWAPDITQWLTDDLIQSGPPTHWTRYNPEKTWTPTLD